MLQAEERAHAKALRPETQGLRDRRLVWLGRGGKRTMWEVGEMVKPQCLEVFRGAGCSGVGDPFREGWRS